MVSTYFSYSYIARNLKQSLTRVEQQQDVAREAAYYKAHIGKVKSVDDFMKDYRLYHYITMQRRHMVWKTWPTPRPS